MGLLTALRPSRKTRYRVTTNEIGVFQVGSFRTLEEARAYADYLATTLSAVCFIDMEKRGQVSRMVYYCTPPQESEGDDEGSAGVREPRHPKPGSSSGEIRLDLPN